MLLINIVNKFFPAYAAAPIFQKQFLLNVQNAYALAMLFYLMLQLCNCTFYNQCDRLITSPQKFFYYFIGDILLCEPSIYIHHIVSFVMAHTYNSNIEIMKQTCNITIGFGIIEISTIFLTIRAILKNYKRDHQYITMFYNINDIIFAVTFLYTRVYLYWPLFGNEHVTSIIMQLSPMDRNVFNACLYFLYLLNLYWGCKITRSFLHIFTFQRPV